MVKILELIIDSISFTIVEVKLTGLYVVTSSILQTCLVYWSNGYNMQFSSHRKDGQIQSIY